MASDAAMKAKAKAMEKAEAGAAEAAEAKAAQLFKMIQMEKATTAGLRYRLTKQRTRQRQSERLRQTRGRARAATHAAKRGDGKESGNGTAEPRHRMGRTRVAPEPPLAPRYRL